MFVNKEANAPIKIIDFGLSHKYAGTDHLHDAVGTIYTMAPELLLQDYDDKVDVWAVGVIAFMLMSSSMPFYGKTRTHMVKSILAGKYSFSGQRWRDSSQACRHFVRSVLQIQPEDRPTAGEALMLPWMQTTSFEATIRMLDRVQASMQVYSVYVSLKKLALMVIAHKSTTEEIGVLREIFDSLDIEKDGEITREELTVGFLKHYVYTEEELDGLFRGIDFDSTGVSTYRLPLDC
jgi:calcium-dependent protein kinase